MACKKAAAPTEYLPCPTFSNGLPPGGYDATLTYDPTSQGLLNYNDTSCLIFAPMSASDDNGTFANLAEPSSPLLLATA